MSHSDRATAVSVNIPNGRKAIKASCDRQALPVIHLHVEQLERRDDVEDELSIDGHHSNR